MSDDPAPFESPFNAIPPVILILVVAIAAIELTLSAGQAGVAGGAQGVGWRLAALNDYAFSPAVLDYVWGRGDASLDLLKEGLDVVRHLGDAPAVLQLRGGRG